MRPSLLSRTARPLALAAAVALATAVPAADASTRAASEYVHVLLDGTVDMGMAPLVDRAIRLAQDTGAAGVLLEINTLGGRVDSALLIRDAILEAKVPVHVYVNKRAISAGALIALAADSIDMAPGSTIGAATPVHSTPTGEMEPTDEKITSYLRKEFSATAEARSRRTDLAEAMVDRDVAVEGVVEAGKLLTLTTDEAVELGIADRSSDGLEAVLAAVDFEGLKAVDVTMNWAERIARVLTHPVLAGLLLTIGFLGLLFEVKTPGWGVGGSVGLLALFLFFAGHHVVMLAGWEDLLLVVIGIVLLALEIFVIPGFGVAGVLGIVSLCTGLVLAMVSHDWHAALAEGALTSAITVLSFSLVGSVIAAALMLRYLPESRLARKTIVLGEELDTSTGTASFARDLAMFVGRSGRSRTPLRPAGTVIVDGERLDAVSEGEVIDAGVAILVVDVRGGSVVVREEPGGGTVS